MTDMDLTLIPTGRSDGLFVRPSDSDEGLAALAWLEVEGPDAASFLHSQTTNDVLGLDPGRGCASARVTRTGHLVSLFSCHRIPQGDGERAPRFCLIVQRQQKKTLIDALEEMHFTDKLTITDRSSDHLVGILQGPKAAMVLAEVYSQEQAISEMMEHQIQSLDAEGEWLIRRSFTGDPGFLFTAKDAAGFTAVAQAAKKHGLLCGDDAVDCLEHLRVEAGLIRMGPDTVQKRLLPETGLEQQTVSYSKGCYLGQEVIARVRTYGSLPKALRILSFDTMRKGIAFTLDQIPAEGEPVVLADGSESGHFGSRAYSPIENKIIAYAYLKRAVRTPGETLMLWGKRGPMKARVLLPPVYKAADQSSRVQYLYDRAIRVFANGEEEEALGFLEEALRIDPGFADGYEVLGVILGRKGWYHEAIDIFKRLEEFAPHEPMVNTNLSLYYMKLGDKQIAEDHSAIAAQKSMRLGRIKEGATASDVAREQELSRRKDAERKRGMFQQVLDFDPVDPIALFGMGSALSTLGEMALAAGFLERASQVDKNNSAVYLAWGKCLESLQRIEEAMNVYNKGVTVASTRGDLMPLKEMEHRVLLLQSTSGH